MVTSYTQLIFKSVALKLFREFIIEFGSKQVNLTGDTKKSIRLALDAAKQDPELLEKYITPTLFNKAQEEVLELLQFYCIPRFLKSQHYSEAFVHSSNTKRRY